MRECASLTPKLISGCSQTAAKSVVSIHGAAGAGDALYNWLPGVMPFDEQTAGIHILAPRTLREASFHAGHVFSALLWRLLHLSLGMTNVLY